MKKVEKKKLITALYCRLSVDDFDEKDKRKNKEELESNSITHQDGICQGVSLQKIIISINFYNQR